MIMKDDSLKKLRAIFDLNIYEVKVWTALLSRGVATAGELADISSVPRSRSYDVLETLEKKGFIIMKLGKPIKYIAVKPEEILKRVKQRFVSEAEEKSSSLDKVKDTNLYEDLELLYKQGIDKVDPAELSGLIKGRKNIYEHMKTIVNNAEQSITIMTTKEGIERKGDILKPLLARAAKKGINIKIATPDIEPKLAKDLKDFADIKLTQNESARFIIVDGKQLLFMINNDKDVHESYDLGIWVSTPFFSSALEQLFDVTWNNLKSA